MENDFRKIARKVDKETPQHLRGSLNVRPLKLAFVINESISVDKFREIVEYQSTLWGGKYNLLVPTDGNTIQRNWLSVLRDHNSDSLICCRTDGIDYSDSLINQLTTSYDALKVTSWQLDNRNFAEEHFRGIEDQNGLTSAAIISHFYRREKTIAKESSNAAVLAGSSQNPYYLYLAIQYGSFLNNYLAAFTDVFKAKQIQITESTDITDYLQITKDMQGKFTPLSLASYGLTMTESLVPDERPDGINIFLLGNHPIRDLCLAWNFRLTPNPFGRLSQSAEIVLSSQDIEDPEKFEAIVASIKKEVLGKFDAINLHSLSITNKKIRSIVRRFSEALDKKTFSVHREIPPVGITRLSNREVAVDLLLEEGHFVSKKEQPGFDPANLKGVWINEFKFGDRSGRLQFPDSSRLNDLLSVGMAQPYRDYFGFSGRQTNNGLAYKATAGNDFVHGRIPSDVETFSAAFEDKELFIKPNTNHSYIVGLNRMFSEIGGQRNFSDPAVRHLLWESARAKKSLRLGDIKGLLKRNDNALIDNLIKAGIFLRGVELVCENCGLRHWYSADLIREIIECIGCQKKIRLPLDSSFSFKLNQLAVSALLAGSGMALLLLEHFLSRTSSSRPVSVFGADVYKPNASANFAELDLLTYLDGQTILAECKDFKSGLNKKQYQEALIQVKGIVRVAKIVEAQVVLFASFSDAYTNEFSGIFKKLSTRSGIPVNMVNLQTEEILDCNSKTYVKMSEVPFYTFFGDRKKKRNT
jgi:hypothetical protein